MRIHVVGIGGSGMSAIARLLLSRGHEVSGSDSGRWPLAAALVPLGARVFEQFGADHVRGADVVLRSSAYGEEHVEVAAGRAAGIPQWRRHEAWAYLAEGKRVLAVAGAHGKTTTTALAWSALQAAGIDASLICGAPLLGLDSNAHVGASDVLVIEADEYDRTFLALRPTVGVVTNVEHDHVDQYPTFSDMREAFVAFAAQSETLVTCADDAPAAALRGAVRTRSYGTSATAEVRVSEIAESAAGVRFRLALGSRQFSATLRLPGAHNALNAAAAVVAAAEIGVAPAAALSGAARFTGTARRLEILGTAAGVTVVDSYAHHPTELRADIAAMRPRARGRLVAVFQPHTPSRLAAFRDGFALALREADLRFVVRTFPSAREGDDGGAGARDLAARAGAEYADGVEEAAHRLRGLVRTDDLVLVMGAGDIRPAGELLLRALGGAE